MRRTGFLRLTAVFICAILFSQCKKGDDILDSLTHFTWETEYVVEVPASPVTPFPVSILTPDIKTHSDVAFDENNTRADLVEQIILKELDLAVQSPSGGTLSFLKKVDIYAMAEGLPAVRVAYKDEVPADVGATLTLDVTNAELKEYFKRETYVLRITVMGDEDVTEDYAVKARAKFFVDAKVAGK